MNKFKVMWNEVHTVIVEAEDAEDATTKVGDDDYSKKDEKIIAWSEFEAEAVKQKTNFLKRTGRVVVCPTRLTANRDATTCPDDYFSTKGRNEP